MKNMRTIQVHINAKPPDVLLVSWEDDASGLHGALRVPVGHNPTGVQSEYSALYMAIREWINSEGFRQ